ncbi:MAG TPA: YbjN domain-containing protein [Caulobacteraceae bacterium]|nr:YbjN domain-containing protein [Caulobacteraceae bacterium]
MKFLAPAACATLFLIAAAPAAARPLPERGMTLEQIAEQMREAGYKAQIVKEGERRHVASATGGVNFEVYPDDCKEDRCASMQFSAGFDMVKPVAPEKVNEWARTKRWARMHLDEEGDPFLSRDVNLAPGGTTESFAEELNIWDLMVGEFTGFIGW